MPQYQANNNQSTYQTRYQRSGITITDKMWNAGPVILAVVSFILIVLCLISLEFFDIVIGKYTAGYMTQGKYDWLVSGATTGLTMALIGTMFYGYRERWHWGILITIGVLAFIPASLDVIFDGMSVDLMRFGYFIDPNVQFAGNPTEQFMHNAYRVMFGALSAVGEPIGAGSVIIFPIMKELFKGVFS